MRIAFLGLAALLAGCAAAQERWVECAFLVPVVRDSDRAPHPPEAWKKLEDALYRTFHGYTGPMGPVHGAYDDNGRRVDDESRQYVVAIPEAQVNELRALLRRAARMFDQKSIYLSVGGAVEFIDPSAKDEPLW
jgi:hypothetical protein